MLMLVNQVVKINPKIKMWPLFPHFPLYEKERDRKNNQKTNISKKQDKNNTRNTDASCDETITKTSSLL